MRSLIISLTIIAFLAPVTVQGQQEITFSSDGTYHYYDAEPIDSVSENDTAWYYIVNVNKSNDLLYDIQVKLDSLSGDPEVEAFVLGRYFDEDDWVGVDDTVTWDGTESDTTFKFQEHSTGQYYRQYKLMLDFNTGSSGNAAVNSLWWKFYIKD